MSLADYHLVLLPGLDGTGKLFDPFIQQFPDAANITVINYPTGRHIPYTQLLNYILPLLPQHQPLVLLGESYSGPVCLQLATRKDLNIRAIILVATFAKYPPSFLKSISRVLPLSLLVRLPVPEFVIRHYCFGKSTTKQLSALLRQSVRANLPGVLAQRARDGSKVDVTDILHKIDLPVLYIAATNDSLVPSKAMDDLQGQLSNLRIETIEGAHFILQVQPSRCYNVIEKFLSRDLD